MIEIGEPLNPAIRIIEFQRGEGGKEGDFFGRDGLGVLS